MFTNIPQSYDLSDATVEILVMLAVAFLLGYLFRYFLDLRSEDDEYTFLSEEDVPAAFARFSRDDLKVVEGIGAKIEELLKDAGITTWDDLAAARVEDIKKILEDAGDRFRFHDPSTWPDQAALARDGRWRELQDFQDVLDGGKMA